MLNLSNRIAVKGLVGGSLLGLAVGVGDDATAQEPDIDIERQPCHVQARVEVRYDDDHPRRVGFVETDENCVPHVRYEDLSVAEWDALNDRSGRHGTDETRTAESATPKAGRPSLGTADHVNYRGALLPGVAGTGTRTPHGHLKPCHRVSPINCVDEVELDSWFTFSWNTSIGVTNAWDAGAHRWIGACWGYQDPWDSDWVFDELPDAVGYEAESGYHIPWYTFCPDLGYGGELYVKTWGAGNGEYGVVCEEDFTGPYPTEYPCWAELD